MTSSDMRAIWPGALLVVYLSATGILLLIGHARVTTVGVALHFAVLGAIAAATWVSVVPRWLRAWAPLLALLFLYTEMPMLIRAAGHGRFFDPDVMRWEDAVFGSQPAQAWAAHWQSLFVSELLHGAYLSYYGIIFAVPLGLYATGRRAEFSEAVFVLLLTFIACFVCYIVFPVAGPRYFWPSSTRADSGPIRVAAVWLLEARSSRGTAFPSSHVAVAFTQSILAMRYFGRRGAIIGALGVALALGAVYGGFHYAIDVVAGAILGVATGLAGLALTKRASASQPNAIAPT
jgi:membrane-associated phospholipid phosphatase